MAAPDYVYDLLASESLARWNGSGPLGTPVTITYRFPTTQPSSTSYSNYTPFTETEITATERALDYISSITRITFVEATDASAQLQFGNADLTPFGSGVSGRASYSYNGSGITNATVVLSNTGGASLANSDFVPGSITSNDIGGGGWQTLLHEIGHALGLKHPFERNIAGDPNSVLPTAVDDYVHTIMSYTPFQPSNVAIVTGNENSYSYSASSLKPQTYGLYDVAALQYLYGAPTTPGNRTYALSPNAPIFETIYDRGPNSLIDLSAFSEGCTIDMNPGAINSLPIEQPLPFEINLQNPYDGSAALAIAYGSLIGRCIGGSGNDIISGNGGANTLNGGAGADTLAGRGGGDTYVVDNLGDRVVESGNDTGIDTVLASVSFSLKGQSIENLTLTGSNAINATGNSFANAIGGNNAANRIDGGAGADTMSGKGGGDTYLVDSAGDRVIEASGSTGTDTVLSSVSFSLAGQYIENLTLTGSGAINGKGNGLANSITGNGAANTLTGGTGTDTFVFNTALGVTNVDRIADFSTRDDGIQLSKAIFKALGTGTLAASAFKDVSTQGPADASDRILYSSKLGALSYDADGSGTQFKAVQFAILDNKAALTFQDFLVV